MGMTGRKMRMRALAVSAIALAGAAIPLTTGAARTTPVAPASLAVAARPNVLFILIDDMGYGDLSVAGNNKVATPNIDKLASEGLLMTQFYDAAPICSASRAGFFTGQFPARNGFVTYINTRAGNARAGQADWLDPKVPTLARAMHDGGYATGHFGKWHMGGGRDVGNAPMITQYGFDESYTQFEGLGPRVLPSDTDAGLSKASAALGKGPVDFAPKSSITSIFVDKALDFITRKKGSPWFVQVWPGDVHAKWAPTPEQFAFAKGKGRNEQEDKFLAVLVAMDKEIGRLIEGLRASGQLDNTLIVLTSDNGPTANHGKVLSPGSAGMFRGRKASLYEGGTRQPMIVRWPGHVPAGKRDDTTVGQGVDLFPSIATAVGVKGPAKPDGISLFGAWQGIPIRQRPDLYWTFGASKTMSPEQRASNRDASPTFSMRSGNWKLLADDGGKNIELYDLAKDPGETNNVAATSPAIAKKLSEKLMAWRKPLKLVVAQGPADNGDADN
jgi:arylsulfatase A-like enzyme